MVTSNLAVPGDAAPVAALRQMVDAYRTSGIIAAAAKLGIADLLADGAKSGGELAMLTQTPPPSLYRLLRALAAVDVLAEDGRGRFRLTPIGEPLQNGVPGSLRAWASLFSEPWWSGIWGYLVESI